MSTKGDFAPYREFDEHTITFPKKRCSKENVTLGLVSLIFLFIVISCIVLFPIIKDANMLLKDGNKTIQDLNTLIPAVRKALNILETICNNKKFIYYYGLKC